MTEDQFAGLVILVILGLAVVALVKAKDWV